ncbi:MAG: hypothetical protein U0269_22690 [Polyangiales bacterium]
MKDKRDLPLLQWQRSLYDDNHTRRSTLVVHAITNPMFIVGTALLATAPFTRGTNAIVGLALALVAMALQGRTHRAEPVRPVPFASPFDAIARIFAEQWVTFPRFVMDGGFARAWRSNGGDAQ